jgi:hypothetical protein
MQFLIVVQNVWVSRKARMVKIYSLYLKQPSLVRLFTEMQERNIFASTKTNTVTCDLSCKRYVDDCVQCNAHLCSTD